MLKRARYIHCPTVWSVHHGFSAEISPNSDPNSGNCFFRITICNSKDQFSRVQARYELSLKPWQEVRVVDIPKLLADAWFRCETGRSLHQVKDKKTVQRYQNQWAWVYKYFL